MNEANIQVNCSDSDASQTLVSRLSELIPKMVWLGDCHGKRFFFSPSWLNFAGSNLEATQAEGWLDLVHENDRDRVSVALQSAVAANQPFHIEYRLRRRDGVFRQILDSGMPEFNDEGLLCGFLGVSTDINETAHTPYKKTARDSLGSQPLVDTHFNSPIAIWKLDRDCTITKANPAVYEHLGYTDNIIGRKLSDVVPSISEQMLESVLTGKMKLHITCSSVILAKPRGGTPPSWTIAIWPVTDSNGEATGICVSTIEHEQCQRTKNLSDVVAALVHDLKSPLIGAERTFDALLKGAIGELDHDLEKILQILNRGNRSMLDMIQNLIELQRSELGNIPLILEPEDVYGIARSTLQELDALARDREIQLIDKLPQESALLPVERTSLKRVFHNLLSNAIKFTNRGGVISLESYWSTSSLAISVSDTGIGIPPEDQSHLFERYFQGGRGRRYSDGSGLGLYLCKNIVERHGGRVLVKSEEGKGSIFTVSLPLVQS